MQAVELRELDRLHHDSMIAYFNLKSQAKKKVGKDKQKLVYDTPKKLFDYEGEVRKALHQKPKVKLKKDMKVMRELVGGYRNNG
ncbi:MAG: hypothetical protein Q4B15_03290 [Lachnospiraceae bacterium]|nr:hypothetical protein [Lachnospiraceae bacterium]